MSKREKWVQAVYDHEGRFKWAGSNPKDWDSNQKDLAMNCWCAPIYIAYQEGFIKYKSVEQFIMQAFKYKSDVGFLFKSQMAAYDYLQGDKSTDTTLGMQGDILFFLVDWQNGGDNVDLSRAPVHVAVNLGDGNCMSLWSQPNNTDHFQNVRVTQLVQLIETEKRANCTVRSVTPFWILGKKNGCYITTATCEALGKPDDCYELTMLRAFRDQVLLETEAGSAGVESYYAHAPAIVAAINQRPDAAEIYQEIYESGIMPSIEALEAKDYKKAESIFAERVKALHEVYIGPYRS